MINLLKSTLWIALLFFGLIIAGCDPAKLPLETSTRKKEEAAWLYFLESNRQELDSLAKKIIQNNGRSSAEDFARIIFFKDEYVKHRSQLLEASTNLDKSQSEVYKHELLYDFVNQVFGHIAKNDAEMNLLRSGVRFHRDINHDPTMITLVNSKRSIECDQYLAFRLVSPDQAPNLAIEDRELWQEVQNTELVLRKAKKPSDCSSDSVVRSTSGAASETRK